MDGDVGYSGNVARLRHYDRSRYLITFVSSFLFWYVIVGEA
jgi:hypothetical protein